MLRAVLQISFEPKSPKTATLGLMDRDFGLRLIEIMFTISRTRLTAP